MSPTAPSAPRSSTLTSLASWRQVAGLIIGGCLLLGGCAAGEGTDVVHVEITDNGFDPALTVVPVGTEVRFWSNSPHLHTVTSSHETMGAEPTLPPGAQEFDSGRLREGETFALSFDVIGDHVFWCEIHRDEQMVGVIRVGES